MNNKYFIHPTSEVEEDVVIGDGTKVWRFCHIRRGARVGKNCNIGQNVFIDQNVVIGNGVKLQNNVSVYTGVTLEDYVFIGPAAVFTNVINPRAHIERKKEFKPTLVKRGATIGANATIVCGVVIGEFAFIGAGALVNRDVPDFALMVGNPAKQIGWMCQCGVKLKPGTEREMMCEFCGAGYRQESEDRLKLITPPTGAGAHLFR